MKTLQGTLSVRRRIAVVAALAAVCAASPVFADCYDLVGCSDKNLFSRHYDYLSAPRPDGPNCDFLWMMRNRIYQEHGYCFATARGISEMGNEGCHISNQAAVPLSNIERANIATIQRAERAKNCPA
ncbi:MAG: YARHG domain-containing protein [Caulobacterales bacterium]